MSNVHSRTWNMAKKNENHGKLETHTVGREIWQEPLENMKNEKYTFQTLDFCEKNWKIRHKHCMTWNMARNTEKHGK